MIIHILLLAISGVIILIDLVVNRIYTKRKLQENQQRWDEYSKNITYEEKMEVYLKWCEERKASTGNKFYYFPRM